MFKQPQLNFFEDEVSDPESIFDTEKVYILLTIQHEYFLQIKQGIKKYEYRRLFRRTPTTTFLYITAPQKMIAGVVELAAPIVASPERIAKIAEDFRPGSGDGVFGYLNGLEKGYAIPIVSFTEFDSIPLSELKRRFPCFAVPQSYMVLNNYPDLLEFLMERTSLDAIKRSANVERA